MFAVLWAAGAVSPLACSSKIGFNFNAKISLICCKSFSRYFTVDFQNDADQINKSVPNI